jgi:hypothetical protein
VGHMNARDGDVVRDVGGLIHMLAVFGGQRRLR